MRMSLRRRILGQQMSQQASDEVEKKRKKLRQKSLEKRMTALKKARAAQLKYIQHQPLKNIFLPLQDIFTQKKTGVLKELARALYSNTTWTL